MQNEIADVTPAVTGRAQHPAGRPQWDSGLCRAAGRSILSSTSRRRSAFSPTAAGGRLTLALLRAAPSRRLRSSSAIQAVNYVNGFNVNSIVIELPSSMLENGAPGKIGSGARSASDTDPLQRGDV